jgi:anti-sigma B factor antagonist
MIPTPSTRRTRSPGMCWVVRVSGEVDLATAPALALALEQVPGAATAVVVDLRGVTFMDCSGLPVLLRARRRYGLALSLGGSQGSVVRLLEATGLASHFVMQDVDAPCPLSSGRDGDLHPFLAPDGIERCPGVDVHLGDPGTGGEVAPTIGPAPRSTGSPVPPWPPPMTAMVEQAVGLLMGTHRCGALSARNLLFTAATTHGVSVLGLAVALTAAAARTKELRCTPATLTALIAVMKPGQSPSTGPVPSPKPASPRVLRMVRQRPRQPGGSP